MSILSFLSTVTFCVFIRFTWTASHIKSSSIRASTLGITACLSWWSFCNAFFFSASNETVAFMWHRLSSLGWCVVPLFTLAYAIALASAEGIRRVRAWTLPLMLVTIAVTSTNFLGDSTCAATGLVPSAIGWGWTYVNNASSWRYLLLMGYLFAFFGAAIALFFKVTHDSSATITAKLSFGLAVTDIIVITAAMLTDLELPLFSSYLPPIANILSVFFALSYTHILSRYDIKNLDQLVPAAKVVQDSFDPIVFIDADGEILSANKSMEELAGAAPHALEGQAFADLFVDTAAVNRRIGGFDDDGSSADALELKYEGVEGKPTYLLLNLSRNADRDGSVRAIVVYMHDVTERIVKQEHYRTITYHDDLTGLYNRRYFDLHAKDFIQSYGDADFAVLMVDLDDFKSVNDRFGHLAGDEALAAAARMLQSSLNPEDLVCRYGGDEFIILLGTSNHAVSELVRKRIDSKMERVRLLHVPELTLHASVGCAWYSEHGSLEETIASADKDMYRDKESRGTMNLDS